MCNEVTVLIGMLLVVGCWPSAGACCEPSKRKTHGGVDLWWRPLIEEWRAAAVRVVSRYAVQTCIRGDAKQKMHMHPIK